MKKLSVFFGGGIPNCFWVIPLLGWGLGTILLMAAIGAAAAVVVSIIGGIMYLCIEYRTFGATLFSLLIIAMNCTAAYWMWERPFKKEKVENVQVDPWKAWLLYCMPAPMLGMSFLYVFEQIGKIDTYGLWWCDLGLFMATAVMLAFLVCTPYSSSDSEQKGKEVL